MKEEMKEYCTNETECRRKVLMAHFGGLEDFAQPDCKHLCCDVCAQSCKCGTCSAIVPSLRLEDVDIEEIEHFEPPLMVLERFVIFTLRTWILCSIHRTQNRCLPADSHALPNWSKPRSTQPRPVQFLPSYKPCILELVRVAAPLTTPAAWLK